MNGVTVDVPALRERTGDVALLADYFVKRYATQLDKNVEGCERGVYELFADYAWPGNIRQLANALQTACALLDVDEADIGWQHLPDDLGDELRALPAAADAAPRAGAAADATVNLKALSAAALQRAIVSSRGNVSEAARQLGISRNTFYRHLHRSGCRSG